MRLFFFLLFESYLHEMKYLPVCFTALNIKDAVSIHRSETLMPVILCNGHGGVTVLI